MIVIALWALAASQLASLTGIGLLLWVVTRLNKVALIQDGQINMLMAATPTSEIFPCSPPTATEEPECHSDPASTTTHAPRPGKPPAPGPPC